MPDINRLYLDTNVFIAMAEGADAISTQLFELAGMQRPGEQFLFTSELSLAELLVQPYRRRDEALIQLYDNWMVSGGWLTVGPVDRYVLWYAAQVRLQYSSIKLSDAIHLSTAVGFQCSHFLTADKRLPTELELWHERWGVKKGPARLTVLRLSTDVVHDIVQGRSPS